jgi:hypothetical protein
MLVAVEQAGCSGAGIWQVIKSRYISEKHFDVNAVLGKSQGCNGLCVGSSSPPMSTQPFMAPIDFISMDFMLQTSKNNSDSRFCHSHMSLVT